jgi:hypothetical protein
VTFDKGRLSDTAVADEHQFEGGHFLLLRHLVFNSARPKHKNLFLPLFQTLLHISMRKNFKT